MRYAVIENGIVTNVIVANDPAQFPGMQLVQTEQASPGWTYSASQKVFTPPVVQNTDDRWISSAEFIRRFTNAEWDAINHRIAGNGSSPDVVLSRLKDQVMTGDPNNPGNVFLDSEELSAGLNYLVSIGIINSARKDQMLA